MYDYLSSIMVFILNIIFYGFWISLIFVSCINRYLYKKNVTEKDDYLSEGTAQINKDYNSGHTGFVGFLGRSVLNYIRFTSIIIGYIPLHCIRLFLYKHVFLIKCGSDSIIHYGLTIMGNEKIEIASNTIIGDMCTLDGRNGLYIGHNVNFSSKVSVYTEQHDYKNNNFDSYNSSKLAVKIKDYAWIGPNVIILPGVTIGEGAVIGAGSVVTKDIEPYTLAVGIPAKAVSTRPKHLKYNLGSNDVKFY